MATKKSTVSYKDIDLNQYLGEDTSYNEKNLTSSRIAEMLSKSKKSEVVNKPMEITEPAEPTRQPEPAENTAEPGPTISKRVSTKQRKASLEEYKNTFLLPPKITDRKTVYLSNETRDLLDEIVRRLGERGSSVSGFIENMAKEHLEVYRDEIDQWKRL